MNEHVTVSERQVRYLIFWVLLHLLGVNEPLNHVVTLSVFVLLHHSFFELSHRLNFEERRGKICVP